MTEIAIPDITTRGMRRSTDRVTLLARSGDDVPDVSTLVPEQFAAWNTAASRRHATIACVIPAYNEEGTIAAVLHLDLGPRPGRRTPSTSSTSTTPTTTPGRSPRASPASTSAPSRARSTLRRCTCTTSA